MCNYIKVDKQIINLDNVMFIVPQYDDNLKIVFVFNDGNYLDCYCSSERLFLDLIGFIVGKDFTYG